VRPLAVTSVGLERALAFHGRPSYEIEPLMLANAFRQCQSFEVCVTVGVLHSAVPGPGHPMSVRSLPRVFHTCGKNCGNSRTSKVL
jgi:hypothetical protein